MEIPGFENARAMGSLSTEEGNKYEVETTQEKDCMHSNWQSYETGAPCSLEPR